jgi:hypothetical protein
MAPSLARETNGMSGRDKVEETHAFIRARAEVAQAVAEEERQSW